MHHHHRQPIRFQHVIGERNRLDALNRLPQLSEQSRQSGRDVTRRKMGIPSGLKLLLSICFSRVKNLNLLLPKIELLRVEADR